MKRKTGIHYQKDIQTFKLQSNNVPQGVSVNINRVRTINIDSFFFFLFVSKINFCTITLSTHDYFFSDNSNPNTFSNFYQIYIAPRYNCLI